MSNLPRPRRAGRNMVKPIAFWSYSAWSRWFKCALSAKFRYIDKRPDPPGRAAQRGEEIHQNAEWYVSGQTKVLLAPVKPWKKELDRLIKAGGVVEEPWAFNREYQPVSWKEGWLRMRLDVRVEQGRHCRVVDYKTGKMYEQDHYNQAGLYALGTFLRFLHVETLVVEMWYIDLMHITYYEYDRRELASLTRYWFEQAEKMTTDTSFLPSPGPETCKYCRYKKARGGPCQY